MARQNAVEILIRARDEASAVVKTIDETLTKAGERATAFGLSMTKNVTGPILAATAAAITGAVKLGNYADKLLDLEQMTGLSTDSLQEFRHVARAAGVDTGVLSDAAISLTRRLRATGDEAADFTANVEALGVSTRDANGNLKSMDALMPELIGRLGSVESITERNAIAMQVFGRSASDLTPVLALGADEIARLSREAHSMGEVVSKDALNAANNARIAWENTTAKLGLAGREIQQALIPAFTQFVKVVDEEVVPKVRAFAQWIANLIEWWTDLDPLLQRAVGTMVALGAAIGPVSVGIGAIVRLLPALTAGFSAMFGPVGLAVTAVGVVLGLAVALSGRGDSLDRAAKAASEAFAGSDKASMISALDDLIGKVEGPVTTVFTQLREDLVATGDVGVEQLGRLARAAEKAQELVRAQRALAEAQTQLAEAQTIEGTFAATGHATTPSGATVFDSARQWELLQNQLGNAMEGALLPLIELVDNQFVFSDRAAAEATALNLDLVERLMANASEPILRVAEAVETSSASREAAAAVAGAQTALDEILKYINEGAGEPTPKPTPPPAGGVGGGTPTGTAADPIVVEVAERSPRPRSPLVRAEMGRSEVAGPSAGMRTMPADELAAALTAARDRLGPVATEWADYLATELDRELLRFLSGLPDGSRIKPELADTLREALVALVEAGAPLDEVRAAADALSEVTPLSVRELNELTAGLYSARFSFEEYSANAQKAADDAAKAFEEFPTLWVPEGGLPPSQQLRMDAAGESWRERTGTSGAPVGGPLPPASKAAIEFAAEIARDTVEALVAAGAPIEEILAAVEAWTSIAPQSVATINEATQGVIASAKAAELAAERLKAVKAFDEDPGSAWEPEGGLPRVPGAPLDLSGWAPSAAVNPDISGLPDQQQADILAAERDARQQLVDGMLTMSASDGPLEGLGKSLLAAAADQVPAFGAALQGFVDAGPVGAIVGFFSELLMASEPMQEAFLMINEALAPLGELLGRIIAPALKALGVIIGWVVDALVAVYNFLLGWLLGRIKPRGDNDDDDIKTTTPREHSDVAPGGEASFGRTSPGVQLAVATPLVEAAQMNLAAATLQDVAAQALAGAAATFGSYVNRLVDEGIAVTVNSTPTTAAAASSGTAYLR